MLGTDEAYSDKAKDLKFINTDRWYRETVYRFFYWNYMQAFLSEIFSGIHIRYETNILDERRKIYGYMIFIYRNL